MNKGQITIKDIASELGISPSTVSKALKGHKDISASTVEKVRELAKKWNYSPDAFASSLKGGQSKIIGVIVPEIVHYFFSTVISGIEDVAYDNGYHVMFCQSSELYEREVKAVDALLASRVDGILVSVSKFTDNFDHFRKITEMNIPLVFFDRVCGEIETDKVIVDDEEGGYQATKHLINIGCRNIIHLSGPANLNIGRGRTDGFIRALAEQNINSPKSHVLKCDTPEDAELVLPDILKSGNVPDGIFAVNDLTAAAAMKICGSLGHRVPDDIAVVGFTSGLISDITNPSLTSVEQHGYEIGRSAVSMLIDRLKTDKNKEFSTLVINTRLTIKGSTMRS